MPAPTSDTLSAIWEGLAQETDMFAKTRRERVPVGSRAASLLITVLENMSVSCTVRDRRRNV